MTKAPTITMADLRKLDPCEDSLSRVAEILPPRKRITATMAQKAGCTLEDLIWVASSVARKDKDVERRLRLWMGDCAARVLHIYERENSSAAPREAIVAARLFARSEISAAARAAARAAAMDAAREAAREAAWAAAWAAAMDAAWAAAWAAAMDAARAAARAAEETWQFNRLVARLSEDEPDDWPLPERKDKT